MESKETTPNDRLAPEPRVERDDDYYRNPLWLVVIASGCLFGALTILTVFG